MIEQSPKISRPLKKKQTSLKEFQIVVKTIKVKLKKGRTNHVAP